MSCFAFSLEQEPTEEAEPEEAAEEPEVAAEEPEVRPQARDR